MKAFNHINAVDLGQVTSALKNNNGCIFAGGTDILNLLKDNILPFYPDTLINIKTVPGLDYIKEEGNCLKIGAATRLSNIASDKTVSEKYTAIAQAAGFVASPNLREMGTIGGNLIQLPRCWYFRKPENRFYCIRKGGKECFAMKGENRNHSIFGAIKCCIAVNPGDLAPALTVFNADLITTKRTINIKNFWSAGNCTSTVLEKDEILTEIQIPVSSAYTKSIFKKYSLRKPIDFAIVNCAVMKDHESIHICLNGVSPNPYIALKAEEFVNGKPITEKLAEKAGAAAVSDARPLKGTKYKVQIAGVMVKRALLELV